MIYKSIYKTEHPCIINVHFTYKKSLQMVDTKRHVELAFQLLPLRFIIKHLYV